MPYSDRTMSAIGWDSVPSPVAGVMFTRTARRLRVGGAGDLLLVPVGGNLSDSVMFAEDVLAGEQFDVQCDGIGTGTTCTLITVHY